MESIVFVFMFAIIVVLMIALSKVLKDYNEVENEFIETHDRWERCANQLLDETEKHMLRDVLDEKIAKLKKDFDSAVPGVTHNLEDYGRLEIKMMIAWYENIREKLRGD